MLTLNSQLLVLLLLISYLEQFIDCRIHQQSLTKIQAPLEKALKVLTPVIFTETVCNHQNTRL